MFEKAMDGEKKEREPYIGFQTCKWERQTLLQVDDRETTSWRWKTSKHQKGIDVEVE